MAKFAARVGKHAAALRSTIGSIRGNIKKSIPALNKARNIDYENFRAVRNIMRLQGRDRTTIDRLYAAINLIADCKPEAETVVRNLLSDSQSQLCQDIVCALAHNQMRDGYFVEIGVGNGVSISNTHLLEKKFGWKGLLVEPCRTFHAGIRAHRTAKLDIRAASSRQQGEINFHETPENGEFSFAENARSETGKMPEKMSFTTYSVPTTTLNTILSENGAPKYIDFISLDTEGSEIDILAGFDLSQYQIGLLCIEHNHRRGALEALDAIFLPKDYRRIFPLISSYDAWYMHKSVKSPLI